MSVSKKHMHAKGYESTKCNAETDLHDKMRKNGMRKYN